MTKMWDKGRRTKDAVVVGSVVVVVAVVAGAANAVAVVSAAEGVRSLLH